MLRNALDGTDDPAVLRAAELFYRPQRVTFHEGALLLADAETIEVHEQNRHTSPLLSMLGGPAVTELEILDEENAAAYFDRSDAFDMVLGLGHAGSAARRGIERLLGRRVFLELWVRVRDNWGDDPERYREMGLDFPT